MTDVLLIGATEKTAELRHAIPAGITDPFLYAEVDGTRHCVIWNAEIAWLRDVVEGVVFHPMEELRIEELIRQGLDPYRIRDELWVRAIRLVGLERAVVPRGFPVGVADRLRAEGIELTVDQAFFDNRRRRKTDAQLAGIRRAQRAAEAGMRVAADLLRRASPENGGLVVDDRALTCELIKEHIQRTFEEHGVTADELIVSHGPQTAVGHDSGSGAIAPDDVVLLDLFPKDRGSACFADMTRTFVVGEPPDELREYHALCREALGLAVSLIRPGVTGAELHRAVCDLFQRHGHPTQLTKPEGEVLEDGFYHATGHGVGLEVHEKPSIGRVGEAFVAGDVLAIEPGLYRKGLGGVRLEDLVLVTDTGCEVLTDFPYDLEP